MNNALKQYLASLPSSRRLGQSGLNAFFAEVAEKVVPEIDQLLREQRQAKAHGIANRVVLF